MQLSYLLLGFIFRKWGMLAGSGAVMASANDMTKWMNFHITEGLGANGKRVMAAEHMKEVHKARMLTSLVSSVELRKPQFPITTTQSIYAHGFRKGYYRGECFTFGKFYRELFRLHQLNAFVLLTLSQRRPSRLKSCKE